MKYPIFTKSCGPAMSLVILFCQTVAICQAFAKVRSKDTTGTSDPASEEEEQFLFESQSKRNGYVSAFYRTAQPGGPPAQAYGVYWVRTSNYTPNNFTYIEDHTKFNSAYLASQIQSMQWEYPNAPFNLIVGTIPYNNESTLGGIASGFLETAEWRPNTTFYEGRIEQIRFRVSATSKDHPPLHKQYLKITQQAIYQPLGNGQTWDIIQVEPFNIDLPTGTLKTDWFEFMAPMTEGKDTKISLIPFRLKTMFETHNSINHILNLTKKDDDTGNLTVMDKEGDASYAAPRNNLYVVADPSDGKLKITVDITLDNNFRTRFIAAAYDSETKVPDSDKAFPSGAGLPVTMEIYTTAVTTKEYEIKVGFDANDNNLLDESEANRIEVYRPSSDDLPRYPIVKGISNERYDEHMSEIEGKINFLGQSQPSLVAKYARSLLALLYYNGDFSHIQASVAPASTTEVEIDAHAEGQGFSEWLTHNSGASFNDQGVATIKKYTWAAQSEISVFLAARTPFALQDTVTTSGGVFKVPTPTGNALKSFYDTYVKTAAEQALQNEDLDATVTFPLDGGWYEFPRTENPDLFKSDSPSWITPATLIIGKNDNYSGYGALIGGLLAGTEEFKDFDAFGTIGRGRVLTPRYRITVKKEETGFWPFNSVVYTVSNVLFDCAVEDLYDFNYEDGLLPSHAAAMQIGYGKGSFGEARDRGQIYRHRIEIRQFYINPFN